ncbi:TSUP family transporter [Halomarina halobia]|uniref:Probable membrane transporter protein n=1 Tax=Halomarina halobia TaxID=3033386 RepID=A0ABD6AF12_9EURY|nr:sulfite exporter TauE/SafE family protein [Halomarina sp. PSR21]
MLALADISLSIQTLVLVAVFLLFVGVVKGCTGFAIGLLSVPVLVQLFPPKIALAALTLPMFLSNVPLLVSDGIPWRFLTDRPEFFIAILVGTVVGVLGFITIPVVIINLLLSVYLIGFLVNRHRSGNLGSWTTSRAAGAVVGGIGGVVSGAFLTGGPIFVSFLYGSRAKRTGVATRLALIFLIITGLRILTLYPLGLFGPTEVLLGVGFLVPLTAGILLGIRFRPYVPQRKFNIFVEILLLAIAAKLTYEVVIAF